MKELKCAYKHESGKFSGMRNLFKEQIQTINSGEACQSCVGECSDTGRQSHMEW